MDYQAACTFWSQWFSNKKRKEKKSLRNQRVFYFYLLNRCVFGSGCALGRHFWIGDLSSTAFLFIKSCFQAAFYRSQDGLIK